MEKKGSVQQLADHASFINSLIQISEEILSKHKLLSLIFVMKNNSIEHKNKRDTGTRVQAHNLITLTKD